MQKGNRQQPGEVENGEPQFAALLYPHRSLPANGFIAVMAFAGVVSLTSGLVFAAMGAWPVTAFLGLDVLLLWLAFKLNYRAARQFEEVAVWPHNVVVRQHSPAGQVREHHLNPFFARFSVERHEEFGITRMELRGEGQNISIGAFLNPLDRESFARAFSQALSTVRRR
jgi:uncharacterized membrane protein